MHDLEPFFNWNYLYSASEDERSPFYEREYSEFYYTNKIYNYLIHPQWDFFGSSTLYVKILFTDYTDGFAIIEFIGEWNDAINNDIMHLKRNVIELLEDEGIYKYIVIGENVLNYHASDDSYYEEWWEETNDENGWIAFINFNPHVLQEMQNNKLDFYINFGGELDDLEWRKLHPRQIFTRIDKQILNRIA